MEDQDKDPATTAHSENRQFVRIRTDIPLRYNVLNDEEYQNIREKQTVETGPSRRNVLNASYPFPFSRRDDIDSEIRDYLCLINSKIDYLIGLITMGPRRRTYNHTGIAVEISGNGLKIATEKPLDIPKYIDISLELNFFPYFIDNVFGVVKRIECEAEKPGTYTLAVEFVDLDESIREELVQLTFEKQRQFLRCRKGNNRFDLQP